jgi:FtsZ-interacting cell division protein ZipA
MGPDNRDIEPMREDFSSGYNDQPEFIIMDETDNNEDMEIDENENSGYLRLQTFEGDDIPANDSDTTDSEEDEDENEVTFTNDNAAPSSSVPEILSADSEIAAQIWNQPRAEDSIELSTEKTQQILKAMSQFKLPNVPAWANEVNPSELVKTVLNKTKDPAPGDK